MSADEARLRITALLGAGVRAHANEVSTVPGGWAVRTRDLPAVWSLNQVHLEEPTTTLAVDLAEKHQADLPYRYFVVDDDASARQLAEDLGPRGWTCDRLVVMVLWNDPPAPTDRRPSSTGRAIAGLDEAQAAALMRQWLLETRAGIAAHELEQVLEYHRRDGNLWNERCFGVLRPDGSPANMVKLRSDRTVAWVEDVYTLPGERRRGLARTVVSFVAGLARAEGYELTFLLADDEDWPKHLYAEVGFSPVGTSWSFRLSADS